MTPTWSPQQEQALAAVSEWMATKNQPFFYLAGYAGTGKTTLAKHFAEGVDGRVLFGSFTGRAASVMRDAGCDEATTIHRLIYTSREKGTARLKELQKKLNENKGAHPSYQHQLRREITEELENLKAPHFILNLDSDVRRASLVIIDECSMVNERMGEDLLSFGTPVLVLGDPAQLPPVRSAGYFTNREPDMMLTEVHRQARQSGILRLATEMREGNPLKPCDYGDAAVIRKPDLDVDTVLSYDQILVGRNVSRVATNCRTRELLGHHSPLPVPDDKVVCLRNNHDLGLLNGETWIVDECLDLGEDKISMVLRDDDRTVQVEAWKWPFLGEERPPFSQDRDVQEFDFGNVLTTHKAQGGAWPSVLVFAERFRGNTPQWRYTAVTRASERLTVVLP
jgi:exodeoxyribonuclease-5